MSATLSTSRGAQIRVFHTDDLPGVETFDNLPVVVAHGGAARAVGKGSTLAQRKASALGEWLERSILYSAVPERYTSARELGNRCLPPPLFGLDLPHEAPDLVLPYDPDQPVGWITAESLTGERRWLHQPGWTEAGFYRATSNGAAVGCSRPAALASAVAELLERHAFVAWWYRLASSQSLADSNGGATWDRLTSWFTDEGWVLTAHLMPTFTRLPVVLAAAFKRTRSGQAQAGVIGLGTGAGGAVPVQRAMSDAALEVVQAMETFSILRAKNIPITGDLAEFLTLERATAIESRLVSASGVEQVAERSWLGCPTTAAQEAGIRVWACDRRSREIGVPGIKCFQAFSTDTLPFPSTNRGRRLVHPVLEEQLQRCGRTLGSLPSLPHPLG